MVFMNYGSNVDKLFHSLTGPYFFLLFYVPLGAAFGEGRRETTGPCIHANIGGFKSPALFRALTFVDYKPLMIIKDISRL